MAGKSPAKASDEQRAALEVLAVSRNRGEADRALPQACGDVAIGMAGIP